MTAPEIATPPAARAAEPGAEPLRTVRRALPGLDPLALLATVPARRPSLLWRAPSEPGWVGVGRALRIAPPESPPLLAPLAALGGAIDTALAPFEDGEDAPPLRVFFSVAFDPASRARAFGPGGWPGYTPVEAWLPEILVRCGADRSEALLTGTAERQPALAAELDRLVAGALQLSPEAEAAGGVANLSIEWAEHDYRAQVVAALDTLCRRSESHPEHDDDCLTKVVLSHAVKVRTDRPLLPAAILRELRRDHPGCFLFAVRPAPGAPVFLGASPERLARVEPAAGADGDDGEGGARRVVSGALAGSAPRGGSAEADDALGRGLLGSAKDREEHEIVGDMIAEALGPLCRRVDRRPAPVLEKLATVQHLFTPISGELLPGRGVLDAVSALHPTPAVGGMPRAKALEAIRELERQPRGLYAGVVGWTAKGGTGDSAVTIRSALLESPGETEGEAGTGRATLFAGGGIVRTSDPDVEVEETRLKLAAVLGAMERAACDPDAHPDAEEAGAAKSARPEERERWSGTLI